MLKRLGSLVLFASLVGAVPAEAQTVRFGVGIVPVIGLEDGAGSDFGIGAQLDYVPAGKYLRVDDRNLWFVRRGTVIPPFPREVSDKWTH